MKPISTLTMLFPLLVIVGTTKAQVLKKIGERIEQKAKERADRKIDQTIDKKLDKVENTIDSLPSKIGKPKKKKTKTGTVSKDDNISEANAEINEANGDNSDHRKNKGETGNTRNTATLKVDSKFDFVPGEKIVLLEDFSKYNLGDFPDRWQSNGTAEVVTLNNETGKFLQTKKEVIFYPTALKPLPDEFTLECDLICNEEFNYYSYEFAIGITNAKEIKTQWNYFGRFGHGGENNSRVELLLHPNDEGNKEGLTYFVATHKTNELMRSNAHQNQLSVRAEQTKVHISIWRQKQRVRVYLNEKKVWDIPNALEAGININSIYFRSNGTDNDTDAYYLGNIKIATGSQDTRSKIITEGKYSTSNILFDVNSDRIRTESYGVLKEIATVLIDNKDINVKIIGYTDSDGDELSNITLSQKRAEAVKQVLINSFGIKESRLQTDGKGESQPILPNTTPEAKAQNRRVEFIKL